VDHRVEPSTWFTNGSAEGSADFQPSAGPPGQPAGAEQKRGPYQGTVPAAAYGNNAAQPPHANPDPGNGPKVPEMERDNGFSPMPYERANPPYPAQIPPATPPGTGVAAKVSAQIAALAKPKPKPKVPARTGQTGPMPRMALGPRTGTKSAPTRRAQLTVARIEPWSVMKFSFMVSLVAFVVFFVAVAFLYFVLSKLGVFHSLQSTITSVTSSKGAAGDDSGGQWFSAGRILGYTLFLGAINVVLFTALATVGAVIYNLVTHLAGGIEVTLKETD
jgi:hypothetical protein